ncbi:MAG: putative CoA-binding protein [Candidatus Azotimanducaceae bacterium]|jgi:predicted CoA-binding protein
MDDFAEIFNQTKTIAIVGLSAKPDRASNEVARYLMAHFEIIPVNPSYEEVLGLRCYPDLQSVPVRIDMVDVFQRSENVMPFVQPAINLGIQCFWMQLGIANAEARALLEAAGILVIDDLCTKIEYARL